jgi:hypothetical protein
MSVNMRSLPHISRFLEKAELEKADSGRGWMHSNKLGEKRIE